MLHPDAYRAELDYRRETVRRDLRSVRERRAAKKAARNQIRSEERSDLRA